MKNNELADKHYQSGINLFNEGKYREACDEFKTAAYINNKCAYTYDSWGNAHFELKEYNEAIEKFNRAVEIDPNCAGAYANCGIAHFNLKEYEKAIKSFEKATNIKCNDAVAYYNWGITLAELRKFSEAYEKLNKAAALNPNDAYIYHNKAYYLDFQGNYELARQEWEHASNAYRDTQETAIKKNDADHFLYYGYVQYDIFGKINDAEKTFIDGLKLDPNHIRIHIRLVELYLETKDESREAINDAFWKAREHYGNVVSLLKDKSKQKVDVSDLVQLATVHILMEEYSNAEELLKKALILDNESEDANVNMGILYTKKNKHKKVIENEENLRQAVIYFKTALKLNPYNLTTRNSLAETCYKLKRYDTAEKIYIDEVLDIAPYNLEALIGLGEVYIAMAEAGDEDMFEEAIRRFKEALSIALNGNKGSKRLRNKERAAVLYSLGYARVKLFEVSDTFRDENLLWKAYRHFKDCCKIDPSHHKARRASEKLHKRLRIFSPQSLTEKIAPWLISIFSTFVFAIAQTNFFWNIPDLSKNNLSITSYISITFGALILIIAGLSLPRLLRLKVGAIELEKSAVEQITTSTSLGIKK
ncbi:MAG: tetratricopeptide repeat protein [candidate division Zixibacteria bacterium]|nr:tetratricopeptide repeat protein [candidate division Zixibacteria bacterium]